MSKLQKAILEVAEDLDQPTTSSEISQRLKEEELVYEVIYDQRTMISPTVIGMELADARFAENTDRGWQIKVPQEQA